MFTTTHGLDEILRFAQDDTGDKISAKKNALVVEVPVYGRSDKAILEWVTRRSKLASRAAASAVTTAASRSGPAKLRMDSRERQLVSTNISTSLSRWRWETVAPRRSEEHTSELQSRV